MTIREFLTRKYYNEFWEWYNTGVWPESVKFPENMEPPTPQDYAYLGIVMSRQR